MNADGAPIERWKLLGYERPGLMPDELARTETKQLRTAYEQVCDAMRDAGEAKPNVRVWARCGRALGWTVVEHKRRNVCARPKSKPGELP